MLSQWFIERIFWALILILCVVVLYQGNISYFNKLKSDPIETAIDLVPMEMVPFPVVIVNTGDSLDPLGYLRKSGDLHTEEDITLESKYFEIIHRI